MHFIIYHCSGAAAAALVPRAPTAEGSPFLRQKKSRSYTLPGLGPVKLRHGPAPSPSLEPDRADNLLSLEDFLAEANKTPNRVRECVYVMYMYMCVYMIAHVHMCMCMYMYNYIAYKASN